MKRIAFILSLLLSAAAHACPSCRDALPSTDVEQPAAAAGGFNSSIYFMLAVFLSALGLVGGVVWRGIRSQEEKS